jgi:hypothetical protein
MEGDEGVRNGLWIFHAAFTDAPLPISWEELPLILIDKDLDPCLQLFDIVLFEQPHIALDSIFVIDSLFLHDPIVALIPSKQH